MSFLSPEFFRAVANAIRFLFLAQKLPAKQRWSLPERRPSLEGLAPHFSVLNTFEPLPVINDAAAI